MRIKHILLLLSIFLQINVFAGIAQCYGVSKNDNRAWFMLPSSGASPLPQAREIILNKPFLVGGSAYRVSDEKLYLFDCLDGDGKFCDLYAYTINHLDGISTSSNIKIDIIDNDWSEVVASTIHINPLDGKEYLSTLVITSGAWIDFYQWDMDTLTLQAGMPINISNNTTLRSLAHSNITNKFYVIGDDPISMNPTVYEVNLATSSISIASELEFPIDGGGFSLAGDGLFYSENDSAKHDGVRNVYSLNTTNGDMLKAAIFGGNSDIDSLACNGGERLDSGDALESYGFAIHKLPLSPTSISDLYLGSREGDDDSVLNQHGSGADGDGDDEDGIYIDGKPLNNQKFQLEKKVTLTIQTSGTQDGYLSGWIDFNGDGDFEDAGEKVIDDYLAHGGDTVNVPIEVLQDSKLGDTYVRFRYSTQQNLQSYDNLLLNEKAKDGEVEDYKITITKALSIGDLGQNIPIAQNDYKRNEQVISGTNPTTVDVFKDNGYGEDMDANDQLNPESVKIVPIDGAIISDDGKELNIPNEGVWIVDPDTGSITFTPDATMVNDPTEIFYTVENEDGVESNEAKIVVDYTPFIPFAKDDTVMGIVGVPTVIEVLANDESVAENKALVPASLQIVGTPNEGDSLSVVGEGVWTVLDGKITLTPHATFVGDPTPIKYTIKDVDGTQSNQATVTIHYPAIIKGTIWIDSNNNYKLEEEERRMGGWNVHIINNTGHVVSKVITDKNGYYAVLDVIVGKYTVQFFNSHLDLMATKTTHKLKPAEVVIKDLPLHPTGVIYDSVNRKPLSGAIVSLSDSTGTPLPNICLNDGEQSQLTRENGFYWININFGADPLCSRDKSEYHLQITPPDGYIFPSANIQAQTNLFESGRHERFCLVDMLLENNSCQVQLQGDAPVGVEDTTYFLKFELALGDMRIFHNHIPLDAGVVEEGITFIINKIAEKKEVSIGEFIPYSITISNDSLLQKENISVSDNIPDGFSFVKKSAILTRAGEDTLLNTQDDIKTKIEPEGNDPIIFKDIHFDSKESIKIDYLLQVGVSVAEGNHINEALVENIDGSLVSNRTVASVKVIASPFMDNALVVGKVFHDKNENGIQDGCCEKGIPGVRIVGVDGMVVETDGYGRYHVPDGIKSMFGGRGQNIILKIDTTTLPPQSTILSENPRVYRVTSSGLNVINFSIKLPKVEKLSREEITFQTEIREERYTQKENISIGSIYFDSDQNCIRPDQVQTIKNMAEKLKTYGGGELMIEGNTDARAPAWYNKKLAYKRAQSVYVALKCHLNDNQMEKISVIYDDADKEVEFNPKYDWWGKPNIPRTKKECTKLGLSHKDCRNALKREGGAL